MTLTTDLRIVEPVAVKPIFDECRRLLGGQDVPYEYGPDKWSSLDPKNVSYRNQAGMGLHALLSVTHGADGLLTEYSHEDDETDDGTCCCPPPASIKVSFDTAYGYQNDRGGGCADLHAWLINQLGQWLSDRGLTWYWENEFMGTWHASTESTDSLGNADLGAL